MQLLGLKSKHAQKWLKPAFFLMACRGRLLQLRKDFQLKKSMGTQV